VSNLHGLSEVVLSVRDLERSVRFYRDVVGLRVISPPEMQAPVYFQVGDAASGVPNQIVLAPLPPEAADVPPQRMHKQLRHFAIEVPAGSLAQEEARLRGLGIEVRHGEHPFLPLQALYFDDPDGNEIEFMAPKA
jgi:catechol 2,3-dioxygenase